MWFCAQFTWPLFSPSLKQGHFIDQNIVSAIFHAYILNNSRVIIQTFLHNQRYWSSLTTYFMQNFVLIRRIISIFELNRLIVWTFLLTRIRLDASNSSFCAQFLTIYIQLDLPDWREWIACSAWWRYRKWLRITHWVLGIWLTFYIIRFQANFNWCISCEIALR